MGSHPINLGLRFLLELAALIAVAYWGWNQTEGIMQFVAAIGLPLLWMILWGTFNVPDDPSRSGKAPVKVPGWVRLLLEIVLLGSAVWALYDLDLIWISMTMAGLLIFHYALSFDRLGWLLRSK